MNTKITLNNNIFQNKTNNLILLLVSLVFGIGIFTLFIPIQYVLLLFMTLGLVTFFVIKPEYCFYSVIFTIPFTERLRVLPISFSINDVLIFVCTLAVFLNIFLKQEKVDLKTKLDKWIVILLILYFAAGVTSISSSGILSSFKFLEAIFAYYFAVYFIRTKKVTISRIIRILILSALLQACLGILQSLTGNFGASFQSQRGYLGYLGLGSKTVWHGVGTLGHFNMMGNFLVTILLFLLPINHFMIKNKKVFICIIGLLLLGIITSYSRGSLLGLISGFILFIGLTQNNMKKTIAILFSFIIIISSAFLFLINSSYINTVDLFGRLTIWQYPIASIISSIRNFTFGSGLNSYWDAVAQYLPANIPFDQYNLWFAHNFYILSFQEMGIIGFCILFSFLVIILRNSLSAFKKQYRFLKALSLSISMCVLSIFFVSLFDHAYSLSFFKILLFLMLGVVYARNTSYFISSKTE